MNNSPFICWRKVGVVYEIMWTLSFQLGPIVPTRCDCYAYHDVQIPNQVRVSKSKKYPTLSPIIVMSIKPKDEPSQPSSMTRTIKQIHGLTEPKALRLVIIANRDKFILIWPIFDVLLKLSFLWGQQERPAFAHMDYCTKILFSPPVHFCISCFPYSLLIAATVFHEFVHE